MDTIKNEEVNNGTTEYGLTEQMNTGSKLCKPPSEESGDGLLCVAGEVESEKLQVESWEGIPVELLRNGARELGIELTDHQIEQLVQFAALLVETNKTLNLTRITEPEEIVTSHYLDSFTCLSATQIKRGASIIDIGTGAGFPGIPIKIIRPDLAMTLLDSSRKKLKFIECAVAQIVESQKSEVESREKEPLLDHSLLFVHARAEEACRNAEHREAYDVAFVRALSDMKTLSELCLPLVKVGGVLVAQKSEGTDEEINAAKPIIGQLGGRIENIARVKIPYTDITRHLVIVAKIKPTPPEFPRAFSKIAKGKG